MFNLKIKAIKRLGRKKLVIKNIYNHGEEKANIKPKSHKEKINTSNCTEIKISYMAKKYTNANNKLEKYL